MSKKTACDKNHNCWHNFDMPCDGNPSGKCCVHLDLNSGKCTNKKMWPENQEDDREEDSV